MENADIRDLFLRMREKNTESTKRMSRLQLMS